MQEGATRQGLRVLAADEDHRALEELEKVLQGLGHDVTPHAVRVDQVIDIVAQASPELAVVVLHEDEEHALRLIEELNEYAGCPVVALMESEDAEFVEAAADRGISAYATPLTTEQVQSAIAIATKRHAEMQSLGEKIDQLEGALERRALIERAKGILMERHGVDDRGAFEMLRSHARREQRRVVEVARSVADGHALLR